MDGGSDGWRERDMEGVRERGKEGWRSGREGSFHKSGNMLKLNSHAVSCANADRKITFSQIPASLYGTCQYHRVQCIIPHCALYSTEVWLVHITQCI